MAYRMPIAGLKSQVSDSFRFSLVHPPPCRCAREEWEACGVLRPQFVCRPKAGRSDTALHRQTPLQANAHRLHPAGIINPPSDMFRNYHVIPTDRLLKIEMEEAARNGTCFFDGVRTCCPAPSGRSFYSEEYCVLRSSVKFYCKHLSTDKMTSGTGIFAESKQKGLEAFRKWSASLPIPNRPELCRVIETLPQQPKDIVCTYQGHGRIREDFRRTRDDLVTWFQSRQRDGFYPRLDRLDGKKRKISILTKGHSSRHSVQGSSTMNQKIS